MVWRLSYVYYKEEQLENHIILSLILYTQIPQYWWKSMSENGAGFIFGPNCFNST